MPGNRFIFERTLLAQEFADGIEGAAWPTDYSSGLLMSAPPQTGKTTFLKHDLIPECERRGWLPLYVELGLEPALDPGLQISRLVAQTVQAHCDNPDLTTTLDGHLRLSQYVTLAGALQAVHAATGKLIVLIIDDIELAHKTTWGSNSLFALKAARDALNIGRETLGLQLLMVGSNRADVKRMTSSSIQPLFCANYQDFPLLGRDFTDRLTMCTSVRLAATNQFDPEDVFHAFTRLGYSPNRLSAVLGEVAVSLGAAPDLGELLDDEQWASEVGFWVEAPQPKPAPKNPGKVRVPTKKLQRALNQSNFIRKRLKETDSMMQKGEPVMTIKMDIKAEKQR